MIYRKLDVAAGTKLEDVVEKLIRLEEVKENKDDIFYSNFNGVTIFSKNLNVDEVFLEVTGMTKQEFDNYVYGKGDN